MQLSEPWPDTDDELTALQNELGREAARALGSVPWTPPTDIIIGGCFVVFERAQSASVSVGHPAWAAAVAWRPGTSLYRCGGEPYRRSDVALRGQHELPRQAQDVEAQLVVTGRVSAPYIPGFLALRHGALLAEAVAGLDLRPDVVLVNATGLDHPRRGGLAIHLGAVLELPTVGVTNRPLLAIGDFPLPLRGRRSPVTFDSEVVGYWVCTRRGARPVLAHAGWRTDAETAAYLVLLASTEAARTPVPLQEARRVAREARAMAKEG